MFYLKPPRHISTLPKLRSLSAQLGSPLYSQEQTSPAGPVRSEKCQQRKVLRCWNGHYFIQLIALVAAFLSIKTSQPSITFA